MPCHATPATASQGKTSQGLTNKFVEWARSRYNARPFVGPWPGSQAIIWERTSCYDRD